MKRAIAAALIAVSLTGCKFTETDYDPKPRKTHVYVSELDECLDRVFEFGGHLGSYEMCYEEYGDR